MYGLSFPMEPELRVLYLVSAYPRHPGDVITPWMSEGIRALATHGVQVEVLAPSYRGLESQWVEGVQVHRFRYAPRSLETLTHDQTAPDRIRERPWYVGLLPGYVLAGSMAASRLARSGRFQALHVFWPLPHGFWGLWARKSSGLPLLYTYLGVELTWVTGQLSPLSPLLRAMTRSADAIVVPSAWTEGLLRRFTPEVTPVRIPFGAAVAVPHQPPANPRTPGEPLRLLFIGRLVERKGVSVLLDALALLGAEAGVQLHLVGDGPERARLERRARELGLETRVFFHGFVSSEEKARQLAASHALVLPAVLDAKGDTEGQGVVVLEAMAFARPVLASCVGGIVDMVEHGTTGWLLIPGDAQALADALRQCRDDPNETRARGEAGRRHLESHFSMDASAARLAELYRALAAGHR